MERSQIDHVGWSFEINSVSFPEQKKMYILDIIYGLGLRLMVSDNNGNTVCEE